jgi:O-antigen ligase
MVGTELSARKSRLADWISLYILPFGFFILLTGLFWLGDKSTYVRFYYLFLVLPTCIMILLDFDTFKKIVKNPLVISYLMFGSYVVLTLLWSDTSHSITSLIRRPINIFILFLAFGYLVSRSSRSLFSILAFSAKIAALCGLLSLVYYLYTHHGNVSLLISGRWRGYGALYNPLLTSHVYGFFAVYWLAVWFKQDDRYLPWPLLPFLILLFVVVSTGSRTPLVAISFALIWLSVCTFNKKAFFTVAGFLSVVGTVFYFFPEILTRRGVSYRPEIWREALHQARAHPFFGKGLDHTLMIAISSTPKTFCDPHNIELGVLLSGGLLGLILWFILYTVAFVFSWRQRGDFGVLLVSTLMVFGFFAGLTEGRSFISRPKEHWFLIWIPLALVFAVWFLKSQSVHEGREKIQQGHTSLKKLM